MLYSGPVIDGQLFDDKKRFWGCASSSQGNVSRTWSRFEWRFVSSIPFVLKGLPGIDVSETVPCILPIVGFVSVDSSPVVALVRPSGVRDFPMEKDLHASSEVEFGLVRPRRRERLRSSGSSRRVQHQSESTIVGQVAGTGNVPSYSKPKCWAHLTKPYALSMPLLRRSRSLGLIHPWWYYRAS